MSCEEKHIRDAATVVARTVAVQETKTAWAAATLPPGTPEATKTPGPTCVNKSVPEGGSVGQTVTEINNMIGSGNNLTCVSVFINGAWHEVSGKDANSILQEIYKRGEFNKVDKGTLVQGCPNGVACQKGTPPDISGSTGNCN